MSVEVPPVALAPPLHPSILPSQPLPPHLTMQACPTRSAGWRSLWRWGAPRPRQPSASTSGEGRGPAGTWWAVMIVAAAAAGLCALLPHHLLLTPPPCLPCLPTCFPSRSAMEQQRRTTAPTDVSDALAAAAAAAAQRQQQRINFHVGVLHYTPSSEPFPLLDDAVEVSLFCTMPCARVQGLLSRCMALRCHAAMARRAWTVHRLLCIVISASPCRAAVQPQHHRHQRRPRGDGLLDRHPAGKPSGAGGCTESGCFCLCTVAGAAPIPPPCQSNPILLLFAASTRLLPHRIRSRKWWRRRR